MKVNILLDTETDGQQSIDDALNGWKYRAAIVDVYNNLWRETKDNPNLENAKMMTVFCEAVADLDII